jgi:FtsZ-interacting cell division protein ZipA
MNHQTILIIVIAAIVVVGLLLIAWTVNRRRRTESLQSRFGPEYERTVREVGPGRAEQALLDRTRRVEKLHIRELTADERERFVTEWRVLQSRFVDAPQQAVTEADRLVDRLMVARGYPVTDFEQRSADISVDHPRVVDNYRAARQIALRHRRGEATTEDLRKAVLYYRSLFDDLLYPKAEVIHPKKEVA